MNWFTLPDDTKPHNELYWCPVCKKKTTHKRGGTIIDLWTCLGCRCLKHEPYLFVGEEK